MNKVKAPPPADFEDMPEWTEEMFARARPASEVHGPEAAAALVRGRGRPALPPEERKAKVSLRLSPDVLDALRETGPGWQTRADDVLREVFVHKSARKTALFKTKAKSDGTFFVSVSKKGAGRRRPPKADVG